MGPWGFVALAYGIVWGVILIYWFCLKHRYRAAADELTRGDAADSSNKYV